MRVEQHNASLNALVMRGKGLMSELHQAAYPLPVASGNVELHSPEGCNNSECAGSHVARRVYGLGFRVYGLRAATGCIPLARQERQGSGVAVPSSSTRVQLRIRTRCLHHAAPQTICRPERALKRHFWLSGKHHALHAAVFVMAVPQQIQIHTVACCTAPHGQG